MRIPILLLGLVLCAGGLLLVVALGIPEVAQLRAHPQHPSLLQGTDGASRIAPVWWIGAAFGAVQIAFFAACFALGMRGGRSPRGLARGIAFGTALYAAVFALLLLAYDGFLADPGGHVVLGFPAPTAVMVYGLWPVPLWFLWLYLRHFDEQGVGPEELARLRRIAREVAAEDEPA